MLAVVIIAPGPNFSFIGDGETVESTDSYVDDPFAYQSWMDGQNTKIGMQKPRLFIFPIQFPIHTNANFVYQLKISIMKGDS